MQRNFNEGRKGLDRGQNLDYDCCLKEGEFFKKTNVREVTLLMLKRAQGIVHFRLKSVRLKNIVDGDQTLGKDGLEMIVNVYLRQENLVSTVKKR